jgi:hypothetical protein
MDRSRRLRRPFIALASSLVVASALLHATPATAGHLPTIRVFAAGSTVTVERDRRDFVYVDPGVWVAPVGEDFELRVRRTDYESPITFSQVDAATGASIRTFPVEMLDGFLGLQDFAFVEVLDVDGERVLGYSVPWCPNSWYQQRLSDEAPLVPHYPYACGGGPLTRGAVWGIDEGWAASLIGDSYYGLGWKAERRHYTIRMTIDPAWVQVLEIAPEDAVAEIHVTAVDRGTTTASGPSEPRGPSATPYPAVPDVTDPAAGSLPDLYALPAWNMRVYHRKARDLLAFNATEWNQGPGTFAIEGFRGPDEPAMDAYQYFLVDGQPVGRAQIGQLEFHSGGGHDHWHFEEFTEYSLLDSTRTEVTVSGKQSWCLVNTDAIDLTVPNANWLGWAQDLHTSCGGPGALWIREVLDVGWGDTYAQSVSGQAFDITDLPNGAYYIRVRVNPTGSIHEVTLDNNVEDRLIRLKGRPGHRRVVVPRWNGIDTEGYCSYCG